MYGRRAKHPHEKNMGSYELFAARDARELADTVSGAFDLASTRDQFRALSIRQKLRIENACGDMIGAFLSRTDSQRSPFLRKISKAAGKDAAAMFAVFAIIGLVRVEAVLQLRDRFRHALAPGSGNRSTCAALYTFQQEVADLSDWEWPFAVFDAVDFDNEWADEGSDQGRDPASDSGSRSSSSEVEGLVVKLESMIAGNARQEKEAAVEAQQTPFAVHLVASPSFSVGIDGRLVRGVQASGGNLFRCVYGAKGDHGWIFVAFFRGKPTQKELVERISRMKPDSKCAALAIPASLKELVAPLEAAVGDQYLGVETLSASNARLPFTRWAEDFLSSVEVELALVNEPQVTLDELLALYESDGRSWLHLEWANPKGDADRQIQRREEAEAICMKVLIARGRWSGPVPAREVEGRGVPFLAGLPRMHGDRESADKEIAKLRRTVESGRASEFGLALQEVVTDVQRWIESPASFPSGVDQLGDRLVKFQLGHGAERAGYYSIQSTLHDYFPRGLPESDLMEAAVLRRLRKPMPDSWIAKPAGYGTPLASQDHIAAFWCEVTTSHGSLAGFAGAPQKGGSFGSAIPEGTALHVLPVFRDFGDASATTDNSWARRGGIWAEVLQAFSEVAKGGGASTLRKSEWHVATNSPASRRFALVVVRARQVERIAQVQSTWSEIAKHLNADLESQLKAANIAVTARFNTTLEDFVAPYARKSGSRVALLLGERWVERQPD